jgi:hypothetical protein
VSDRIISRPSSEAYRRNFPWPEKPDATVRELFDAAAESQRSMIAFILNESFHSSGALPEPDSEGGETD